MRKTAFIASFSLLIIAFLLAGMLSTGCTPQQDQTAADIEEEMEDLVDVEGQTITVMNIQKLGQTIEMYIMDNHLVGAPKVSDIEALAEALNNMDWNEDELVISDGWGNNFIYETDMTPGSREYRLISLGADGQPGPEPTTPGLIKQFIEDIIYENGTFTQRPEAAQQ